MSTNKNFFDFKLFNRILAYTKPYTFIFWVVAISAILTSVFAVLQPIYLEKIIDQAIVIKDLDNLVFLISLMVLFLIIEVILQLVFIYYSNWLGLQVVKDIRIKLFGNLIHFKMKYFDKSSVGKLTTRSVNDIETIASIFSNGLFNITSDLLKMIVIFAVMLYKSWELTLIVFALFPIILYATRLFQKAMKKAFEEVRAQVANLNTFVQERITGIKIVQLFTREAKEVENFSSINKKHKDAWIKTVWYNSIFFAVTELLASITIGLIMWYGATKILSGSTLISVGLTIAFIRFTQMLFRPLNQIADKFNTLQMGLVAARRVFEILDTDASINNQGRLKLENIKGHIKFEEVFFSYDQSKMVIKGISLEVQPNKTVAFVGATGAGKSTLVNLMSRLYEIDKGEITIDGINIKDVKLESLRKNVGVVLQDVFLFADTILNNITLNNPAISQQQVEEAAKEIGLHEFISSLPNGYHFNVKERGGVLSSGQRQIISFLRAYVHNPSVLVLDEATSSIDSHTEQLIQNATEKITKGRTSIIIAHRLATIKKADLIVVMDDGKIVETGNHQDLLQIENGYYKNLYEIQFLNELKKT